ncbi:hypothetical protein [Salinisphaera sp. LB1]|uniref:hypothetical protein n=1 Tax=Salinisphaera sp. LB1 TaxID=2183911 RepID=UPI000FEFA686|nr:hypothetical protein [Salinisphaera sp. LB1]
MAIRRDLTAFGLALLLWALQGTAWAQAVDEPAIAAQFQAMLPHVTAEPSPAGASMAQVRNFYAARDFRPAWDGTATVPAFLAARYTQVDDGLAPRDYGADRLVAAYRQAGASNRTTAATRARCDLNTTRLYLSVLDDLNRGKVDPALLGPSWGLPAERYRPDMRLLSRAVDALDFEQAFARARPAHATYPRLPAALAHYLNIKSRGSWPQLPAGSTVLHPGDVDPGAAALRRRLAAIGEPVAASARPDLYDAIPAGAVRRFQFNHDLAVDAVVGAQILSARAEAFDIACGGQCTQRSDSRQCRICRRSCPAQFEQTLDSPTSPSPKYPPALVSWQPPIAFAHRTCRHRRHARSSKLAGVPSGSDSRRTGIARDREGGVGLD